MILSNKLFQGTIDRIANGWAFGWAWDSEAPNEPIDIDIYVDGDLSLTTPADLYRPDLETGDKGNGRHAFEFELPDQVNDGQQHVINIRFSGTNQELGNSPQYVSLGAKSRNEGIDIPNDQESGQPTGPTFRGRFGGLWIDLSNSLDVIEGKDSLGWISNEEAFLLKQFVEDGFVILNQVIPPDEIDRLDAQVDNIWKGTSPLKCLVEYNEQGALYHRAGPNFKEKRAKLLDLYVHLDSARHIIFNNSILRFLALLFERQILAFQSLYFRWGSQQPIHQDTAFVKVSSPLEIVASWIALEDIRPNSGELEYYKGSHKLDDYLFEGKHKWMPTKSSELESFLDSLHKRSQKLGLERQVFLPKKGDVLLWHSNLAHGGRQDISEGVTRKSIVTHYCPINCIPVYGEGSLKPQILKYNDLAYYSFFKRD